jgi:hypothetical protein
MRVNVLIILTGCVLATGLLLGVALGTFHGSQPEPRAPMEPSFTSCREFVGQPERTGSIYYEHQGIAVNLPAGKFCTFPDGTTVGADR